MDKLFRPEAVDFARHRWGEPVNNFGVKSWVVTGFMLAVFLTAMVFLCAARYTRKETVLGAIVPGDGVVRVSPMRDSSIKSVLVRGGQTVRRGDPLFAVSYDVTLETGDALSGQLNATTEAQRQSGETQGRLKIHQVMQERAALAARRAGLIDDIATYRMQHEIQVDRVALLEITVEQSRKVYEQNYMSAVQLRQREDALLQARQSLVQIEQSIQQAGSQMRQIDQQLKGLNFQISEAGASLALSRAQMEEKRLNNLSNQGGYIVAPQSGRVTAVQTRAGDVVTGGQTLAIVVPEKARATQVVHLWAPSRAVGFVRPGADVRLMFDAFPYQTFGVGSGRVVEVSTAPIMPNELPMPIETREQMYRIVVALEREDLTAYGRTWPLTPGMRLTADLVLDERTLLEWLLDPIIAARKRGG